MTDDSRRDPEVPVELLQWLTTGPGRELLDIINEVFDVDERAFRPGADQYLTAFNLGRREVVRFLNRIGNYDPHKRDLRPEDKLAEIMEKEKGDAGR